MSVVIGLYFGNTRSFTSFVQGNDPVTRLGGICRDLLPKQQALGGGIPSVFFYSKRRGELVGADALSRNARPAANRRRLLKRHLGEFFVIDGVTFQYDDAIKKVAEYCIRVAMRELRDQHHLTTHNVSLAYPVRYNSVQRRHFIELVNSITIDGEPVRVTGTIAEPAAAVLDYLAEHGGASREATALVFDLGGGAFDLSVVTVYPNGKQSDNGQTYYYDIVCQNGVELGGEEFDRRLREIIIGKMGEQPTSALADMLPTAVESTKIELSSHESAKPDIMDRRGDYYDFTVTRAEFEQATKDLVDKLVEMTSRMLGEHPEVSMILLTGGASQMPMIRKALEAAVPQYRDRIIFHRPSRAISYGAARYGANENLVRRRVGSMGENRSSGARTPVLGIDIGNGFGYCSLLSDENRDPDILLSDVFHRDGMPTDAYVDQDGRILVQRGDLRRRPGRVIHAIKQHLAAGETITLRDRDNTFKVSADKVYQAIARELLEIANRERVAVRQEPIYRLVLTYPVEFRDNKRILARMKSSVESIELEGGKRYEVIGMLPEPAAVAFDYLYYMRHLAVENRLDRKNSFTVVVYDLGHGTFDTALVSAQENSDKYTVYASEGLPDVGGKNFDEALVEELLRQLKDKYGEVPKEGRREELRRLAARFKHELTDKEAYTDDSTYLLDGEYAEFSLTRQRFEELTLPLLEQTLLKVHRILRYAQNNGIGVDGIVLSGGGSRMPMVTRALKGLTQELGLRIEMHRPGSAVSFGAARWAWQISHLSDGETKLKQLSEYSFGIPRLAPGRLYDEVLLLVPSNAELPATSGSFELTAEKNGVVSIIVRRLLERGKDPKTAAQEDCWELFRFSFEVRPGEKCRGSFTLGEKGEITAAVTTEDGKTLTQSSFDISAERSGK